MLFDWLNTMKLFYILYFTDTYKHVNNAGSDFNLYLIPILLPIAKLAL